MFSRSLLFSLLLCCAPAGAQQSSPAGGDDGKQPSLELLEFLADFGPIDTQTLELMEYHAQRDLQSPRKPGKDAEEQHDDR